MLFDALDFEIGEIELTETLESLIPGEDTRHTADYPAQPPTKDDVWDPFVGW
jgi:hypothetical protein